MKQKILVRSFTMILASKFCARACVGKQRDFMPSANPALSPPASDLYPCFEEIIRYSGLISILG